MKTGDAIPDVTVTGPDGPVKLAAIGAPLLVYFYPRADTPGCTREAVEFSAAHDDFAAAGVTVVGISKDSPAKHARFAARHGLRILLASDADGSVCDAFGVWGEKMLYGKAHMGIERATFLFDAHGTLVRDWRKVRVPGHVDAVLAAARALDSSGLRQDT